MKSNEITMVKGGNPNKASSAQCAICYGVCNSQNSKAKKQSNTHHLQRLTICKVLLLAHDMIMH